MRFRTRRQGALDRQIEIGIGHHDERVLPAELQARVWRLRPHSSPMRAPTALEPVKPTLRIEPSSIARSEPGERRGSVGQHHVEDTLGHARMQDQLRERLGDRRRVLRRLRTTVLQSSAGTMYQEGTATGKFPAVMIALGPTGVRNVNSCLSGSSLGTIKP